MIKHFDSRHHFVVMLLVSPPSLERLWRDKRNLFVWHDDFLFFSSKNQVSHTLSDIYHSTLDLISEEIDREITGVTEWKMATSRVTFLLALSSFPNLFSWRCLLLLRVDFNHDTEGWVIQGFIHARNSLRVEWEGQWERKLIVILVSLLLFALFSLSLSIHDKVREKERGRLSVRVKGWSLFLLLLSFLTCSVCSHQVLSQTVIFSIVSSSLLVVTFFPFVPSTVSCLFRWEAWRGCCTFSLCLSHGFTAIKGHCQTQGLGSRNCNPFLWLTQTGIHLCSICITFCLSSLLLRKKKEALSGNNKLSAASFDQDHFLHLLFIHCFRETVSSLSCSFFSCVLTVFSFIRIQRRKGEKGRKLFFFSSLSLSCFFTHSLYFVFSTVSSCSPVSGPHHPIPFCSLSPSLYCFQSFWSFLS